MTAVKEYMVEVKSCKGEHLLYKFKLVYDWLLFCHLVASVRTARDATVLARNRALM